MYWILSPIFSSKRDGDEDVSLSKDDLWFKILWKNSLNKSQSSSQMNGVDLRGLLSRPAQSSSTSLGTQQRVPQLKDARKHFPGVRDDTQQMQEPSCVRQLMPNQGIVHTSF